MENSTVYMGGYSREEHMVKYPSVLLGKLERFRQDRRLPAAAELGSRATPDCGAQHNSEWSSQDNQEERGEERTQTEELKPRACTSLKCKLFSFLGSLILQHLWGKGYISITAQENNIGERKG